MPLDNCWHNVRISRAPQLYVRLCATLLSRLYSLRRRKFARNRSPYAEKTRPAMLNTTTRESARTLSESGRERKKSPVRSPSRGKEAHRGCQIREHSAEVGALPNFTAYIGNAVGSMQGISAGQVGPVVRTGLPPRPEHVSN